MGPFPNSVCNVPVHLSLLFIRWAASQALLLFFFLAQWVILIGPSPKKTKTWEAPQISSLNFLCEDEVSALWLCEKGETLGKGYSEVLLGTWGKSWGIHWELEEHH